MPYRHVACGKWGCPNYFSTPTPIEWVDAAVLAVKAGWRYRTSNNQGLWYCPEHAGGNTIDNRVS